MKILASSDCGKFDQHVGHHIHHEFELLGDDSLYKDTS